MTAASERMAGQSTTSGVSEWVSDAKARILRPFQASIRPTPPERRLPPGAPRFSAEETKALKDIGIVVYESTGKSLAGLVEEGNNIFPDYRWSFHPEARNFPSRVGEVGFNADNPFLAETNNMSLKDQLRAIARLDKKLEKDLPGVSVIMGYAPDYAELAFKHFRETGRYLFGPEHKYPLIRTQTPTIPMFERAGSTSPKGDPLVMVPFELIGGIIDLIHPDPYLKTAYLNVGEFVPERPAPRPNRPKPEHGLHVLATFEGPVGYVFAAPLYVPRRKAS